MLMGTPRRRLTMLDAMILIATAAAGIAAARAYIAFAGDSSTTSILKMTVMTQEVTTTGDPEPGPALKKWSRR